MSSRFKALTITVILVLALTITTAFATGSTSSTPSPHKEEASFAPTAITVTEEPSLAQLERDIAVVNYVKAVQEEQVHQYVLAVQAQEAEAARQAELAQAEAARQAELARQQAYVAPAPAPTASYSGSGGCASGGGDLSGASAAVVARESGGNYCAANPTSSACGAYQILDSTWAGYGGYASACDAPPAVQDEKARSMAPCNWQPPNYCAGG